jgi:NAD(P)-dependent dehydrogenase (short-subunit alcohol dehydrogenase family)
MHVLVTGANRGLGLEFARQYLAAGWKVTATCRKPADAEALNALDVRVEQLDVRETSTFPQFVERLDGVPVDLLINNAGVYGAQGPAQVLPTLDAASWQETLLVNAIAPIKLTEALLPNLQRAVSPKVVFLSTRMASFNEDTGGGEYVYRSSKAALNSGVRLLAMDLAARGIAVAALHPGWVRTDMGGPTAPVEPRASIEGMRGIIDRLTPCSAAPFVNYDRQLIPW